MTVESQVLDEIVRRIVQVAQPEKIILFGSAARGEMGPHSDVDLLVVKANVHRRRLAQAIYLQLIGVGLGGGCHRGHAGGSGALSRRARLGHRPGLAGRAGQL